MGDLGIVPVIHGLLSYQFHFPGLVFYQPKAILLTHGTGPDEDMVRIPPDKMGGIPGWIRCVKVLSSRIYRYHTGDKAGSCHDLVVQYLGCQR